MEMEIVDEMIKRMFEEGEKITFYELIRRLPSIDKKFAELILSIPFIMEKDSISVLKANTNDEHSVILNLGPDPDIDSNLDWNELVIYFNARGIDTMYYRRCSLR